jgi:hypothetical protein
LDSVLLSDLVIFGNICIKFIEILKELEEKSKGVNEIDDRVVTLLKLAEIVCFVLQFALKISNG